MHEDVERWKAIAGFPERWISSRGRVWSGLKGPGRILRASVDQSGYPIVALWDRRRETGVSRRIHILMADAFIGPRPIGSVIRHLDGDPANCSLGNIVYGTHSENGYDAVAHGTHPQASKTCCKHGHEFTPENTYVRRDRPNRRECRKCRTAAVARSSLKRGA